MSTERDNEPAGCETHSQPVSLLEHTNNFRSPTFYERSRLMHSHVIISFHKLIQKLVAIFKRLIKRLQSRLL